MPIHGISDITFAKARVILHGAAIKRSEVLTCVERAPHMLSRKTHLIVLV